MKESDIEKYLKQQVTKLNGLCLKWTSPGTRGVPDRIIIMPQGKTYYVEMKQTKGALHPLQIYFHKQMKRLGHEVYVLWSKSEVDEFISEVVIPNGD